ncbi:methyl-accepting chemotaxis protein [Leeia sp.]|uniref:methyl-accepting chemotaxis protein n=1 Tax=Leeia sp. TaxID=2884678 RepID=UPI0035B4D485
MSSLRSKLVSFVLILILFLSMLLCGVAYWQSRSALETEIKAEISQSASNKVSFVTEWVSSRQKVVAAILPRFGQGELKLVLDQAKASGGLDEAYVGQPDKTMTMTTNAPKLPDGYDPTGRPWYKAAAATDGPIASPPYIDAGTNQPIISFAQARKDNGQVVAVAGGDVTLKRVVEEIVATKLPGNGYAFLMTQEGEIIAHPKKDSGLKKVAEVISGYNLTAQSKNGQISESSLDGKTVWTALYPVGDTGWLLGVVVPVAEATAPVNTLLYLMLGLLVVGVAIGGAITYVGVSRLMHGLIMMRDAMRNIASGGGDLTVHLTVDSQDEVGQSKDAFNRFLGALRGMIADTKSNAGDLLQGFHHVAEETDRISSSSQQQAMSANATAAAIEEMSVSVSHIADSAKTAEQLARTAGQASRDVAQDVRETAAEISRIADTVRQLSQVLNGLDARSSQISTIVGVIKEIADQTNLLALNAAIEAARAGEQGRGFAVVADEVRKLAERTGSSTVEIGNMITLIQEETSRAVQSMQTAVSQVQSGVEKSSSVAESIQRIEHSSLEVVSTLGDIAAATAEQSSASQDIARNIERINEMTENTDFAIQQAQQTTSRLRQVAEGLRAMMDKFQV